MKNIEEILKDESFQYYIRMWEQQGGDIESSIPNFCKELLEQLLYNILPERALSETNTKLDNSCRDAFNHCRDKIMENYIKFNNLK